MGMTGRDDLTCWSYNESSNCTLTGEFVHGDWSYSLGRSRMEIESKLGFVGRCSFLFSDVRWLVSPDFESSILRSKGCVTKCYWNKIFDCIIFLSVINLSIWVAFKSFVIGGIEIWIDPRFLYEDGHLGGDGLIILSNLFNLKMQKV